MSDVAEASSVLLARGPGSPEVFAVSRARALRFFGGFIAFPGGRTGPEDTTPDPRRAAAVRELFEETGVLLARRPDGSFPPSGPELDALRRDLLEDRLPFGEVLRRLDLSVQAEDLVPAGRLVTPPFTPTRFDTSFFVAHRPANQEAHVWPGELDDGFWTTADALLHRWARGELLVSPPTVALLQLLCGRAIDELPERLAVDPPHPDESAIPPIYFAPAVQMIPLRTVALPPLTHTNAFLVGTTFPVLLDPGCRDPDEQARLFAAVETSGRSPAAIILTHHHSDHIGAAAACAARYRAPVWAHPATVEGLRGRVAIDRLLHDGDRIELGPAPDGAPAWHLVALHTPGHAPGHLSFYDPHYRLIFASDMVSTLTSIVVAPPEGDLAVYLASLRRLAEVDARLLLPAHGGPTARSRQLLEEAIGHRLRREEQLLGALSDEPRPVAELLAVLYKGLAPSLRKLAELQTLAGLYKLEQEGRAGRDGAGWRRA